jgi:2-aminoadipate transaminase
MSADGISFASSRPAGDLFPMDEFRATCEEVIRGRDAASILQLGSPSGYPPLRSYLLAEARRDASARESDDILITSGCQQALDLLQRVLIRPGDTVALEDPVYPGLRGLFLAAGARLAGVPVGVNGIEPSTLRTVIERERPRLLVVTPNFQNPTGATMPLSTRQAILQLAGEHGVMLVENDIYGTLRYEGEPVPSLKQLDPSGDVISIGSFSKVAFPGLRVGWVIASHLLIARLQEAKQWCDLHSDQLSQAVIAACKRHLPAGSRWTHPQGGMNLWVRLPEPLDSADLLPRAESANVNYLPGKYFAISRTEPGALRLSFAGLSPARIQQGVAQLGSIFRTELERVRANRRAAPMPALV